MATAKRVLSVYDEQEQRYVTVHERYAWRYSDAFDYLLGQGLVCLEYLPTKRSRKWRKAVYRPIYSELAYQDGITLLEQEGWYAFRYVKARL